MSKGRDFERVSARSSEVSRPSGHASSRVVRSSAGPIRPRVRWSQRRGVKGVFAALAAVGFAGAYFAPAGAAIAEAVPDSTTSYSVAAENVQSIRVDDDAVGTEVDRASYSVYVTPKPTPTPTPTPTESAAKPNQSGVYYTGGGTQTEWLTAAGIAASDWGYVEYIVHKVPGNGYNPVDNLRWANGYAVGRYGSWAGAYAFWTSNHWW